MIMVESGSIPIPRPAVGGIPYRWREGNLHQGLHGFFIATKTKFKLLLESFALIRWDRLIR
jgi:hypothetical protein